MVTDPDFKTALEGTLRFDEEGQIAEGCFSFDVADLCKHAGELLNHKQLAQMSDLLESRNVEGLQVFWGQNFLRGQISVNGVDLSLKWQVFDVEGSEHSSIFQHDAEGNVTHYHGAIEVTSGTAAWAALKEAFTLHSAGHLNLWYSLKVEFSSVSCAIKVAPNISPGVQSWLCPRLTQFTLARVHIQLAPAFSVS